MLRTRRATCASCSSTPVGIPSIPVRIPSAVSWGETSDGDSIAERARACRISSTSASLKPCRATANGRHSTSRYSASRSRESTKGMRPPSMASSIRAGGASEERPIRALTTTLVSTTATRRSRHPPFPHLYPRKEKPPSNSPRAAPPRLLSWRFMTSHADTPSPQDPSPAGQSAPHTPSPHATGLLTRIEDRTAVVGVIGQGYVGLPLGLVFVNAGFRVLGFDVDSEKVARLERGDSYIRHIGPERVAQARSGEHTAGGPRFTPTTDFDRLAECDAVLICVPTPLGPHREPDLSYVFGTTREIAARLHPGQLVVLESTTYPGTTEEELRPLLEETGLRTGAGGSAGAGAHGTAGGSVGASASVGAGAHPPAQNDSAQNDFFLAFSPEREDPGNPHFSTHTIPTLVGGVDPESTQVAAALYGAAVEQVVPLSSSRVAEAAKLLENIYRSVNIALVNELKMTFEPMGIDIFEVIEAAKTKPFGYQPFYPGPGLGGHCIPLDPFYLSWKASDYGQWTRFINLAGEINHRMPSWVVNKVVEALNQDGKSLKGARVLVLGLSYKPDIDDDRESPSYEIIELLQKGEADVAYCDPYFPETRPGRRHDVGLRSVPLSAEEFGRYDCLVLSTAHREFMEPALWAKTPLVVDTRGAVQPGWGPRVVRG